MARRLTKTSLNFLLAKEYVENDGTADEESVLTFVKTAKRSESYVVSQHLSKAISGPKVFARVKLLLSKKKTPRAKVEDSLESFAEKAIKAAKSVKGAGKWHSAVYISAAWEKMPGDMSLPLFKKRLVEAFQDGFIELSRADLVEAMNPELVAQSETLVSKARFHFIRPD